MNNKINIGTASIVLIFIILCLSVFSLLSLSDAKSAETFAKRRAASVQAYYETDLKGQTLIRTASAQLLKGEDAALVGTDLGDALPQGAVTSVSDTGNFICDIPMDAGQSLHIELDKTDASVLSYYVYISEDYAIDNRMPVWNGNP